jgi:hypothetical protein
MPCFVNIFTFKSFECRHRRQKATLDEAEGYELLVRLHALKTDIFLHSPIDYLYIVEYNHSYPKETDGRHYS